MERLFKGLLAYKKEKFQEQKGLLEQLLEGQKPTSLFLACSDSRIVPNDITNAKPGEIFTIRNAGNIIEPYNPDNPSNEALSLEYGVLALGISEIIVCGHVQCGAIRAVKELDSITALPLVKKGLLRMADNLGRDQVKSLSYEDLIVHNVKNQMKNIYSYPFVKERVENKTLSLWGWVYDFARAQIITKLSLKDIKE